MQNKEHINNLKILRDFLIANDVAFNMTDYRWDPQKGESVDIALEELNRPFNECGTAGCAIGWAPFVIPHQPSEVFRREFGQDTLMYSIYAIRVFGTRPSSDGFTWMFDADWAHVDNTRIGAAYRIDRWINTPHADDQRELRLFAWEITTYSPDAASQRERERYFKERDAWAAERGLICR